MDTYRENVMCIGLDAIFNFMHSLGILEFIPHNKWRKNYCVLNACSNEWEN
jgi:hypothetical protein